MTTENKKPSLPKHCYARGNKIWVRYKDETGKWVNKPCGRPAYHLNQVELARRYVNALLRGIERKRNGDVVANSIAEYARKWCDEREKRGVDSAASEKARLEKYVLPEIGKLQLEELRPRHVAALVYKLRALSGDEMIAPRTIHHIVNTIHTLYESALMDELVWGENPVKLKPGVLPKKVDADPEWRSQATFYTKEILKLISDPIIPVERRVQYAIKALTGMRHGEVAALCWRHIDELAEPLWKINVVQAWSTTKKKIKRTKTEECRAVPVHPTLQAILIAWRDTHWQRVHGRKPEPNDFVVPTRTGSPVDGADAVNAMHRDLKALALRTEAGSRRNRGGHDMRAWYETQTVEDGADSTLIWRTTHAPPKDVKAGYQRFSWGAYCREVAKLKVELDGEPLQVVTQSLQSEAKARGRWGKEVTPKGLEPVSLVGHGTYRQRVLDERRAEMRTRASTPGHSHRNGLVPVATTLATMLERAARAGDIPRVLEIAAELRGDAKI